MLYVVRFNYNYKFVENWAAESASFFKCGSYKMKMYNLEDNYWLVEIVIPKKYLVWQTAPGASLHCSPEFLFPIIREIIREFGYSPLM